MHYWKIRMRIRICKILVLVQYCNSWVFVVEVKLWCLVIFSAFPDYGAGKSLCCHLIGSCVGGSWLWHWKNPWKVISSSQEDVCLAIYHGLGWGCLTPYDCMAPWAWVLGWGFFQHICRWHFHWTTNFIYFEENTFK